MAWEAPKILEEIDMNAEIGAYQNEDERDSQDPIVENSAE